jgi:hypothetical protein
MTASFASYDGTVLAYRQLGEASLWSARPAGRGVPSTLR